MNRAIDTVKDVAKQWNDDNASQLGAALSYYTVFSLAPLLIIVMSVAGLVLGQQEVSAEMQNTLKSIFGEPAAQTVQAMIQGARKTGTGTVAAVIGFLSLAAGAIGVVVQMKTALNAIWGIQTKPNSGIGVFVRKYVVSLAMILALAFILLVSLVISSALALVGSRLQSALPASEAILQLSNFVVSFFLIAILFAVMFKFLPDIKIGWRDVYVGSLFTAVFFSIGKILLGLYIGKSGFQSTYGVAGSVIAVLAWVYYMAQIFFFGAEFTKVHAIRHGHRVVPEDYAERRGD